MRRLQVCAEDGCHELVRSTRCPKHAREVEKVYRRDHVRKIYTTRRWRGLRRQVRREQPWCAVLDCNNLTTDVDHIEPLEDVLARGGDPFDRSNLQGLCKPHHSEKTAKEVWRRKEASG